MMKHAVYFAIIAVMAFEVSSENNTKGFDLLKAVPHDIVLPLAPDANLSRTPPSLIQLSNSIVDAVPDDVIVPTLPGVKVGRSAQGRIAGGKEINPNDRKLYKHQVGLRIDNQSWCGGSIITQNSIITAAHCIAGKSFANVYIGLYDKTHPENAYQIIKITKKNWVQYPGYGSNPTINDLAVINLPELIRFGENVGPIEVECNDTERHENERVIISGWGKYSDSPNAVTTLLRAATVQTAPIYACNIFRGAQILPSMICVTGTNSVGICQGDSGGPIVSTINGKLLGATSFSAPGCVQSLPRIFTRLSTFASWIRNNTIGHMKNC